ncbi:MAG TPA: hypothetical protein DCE41_08030 [Cytophagales bacterium]|nr:hypothetical protein [Cytophagales bacterium]HAA24144.1 hypothetical protein [Cytophagales bacterium]
MKPLILILTLLLLVRSVSAQSTEEKSDLRLLVDSLLWYELNYVIDSTTNALPEKVWDTTRPLALAPSFSTLSSNPLLIFLMGSSLILRS